MPLTSPWCTQPLAPLRAAPDVSALRRGFCSWCPVLLSASGSWCLSGSCEATPFQLWLLLTMASGSPPFSIIGQVAYSVVAFDRHGLYSEFISGAVNAVALPDCVALTVRRNRHKENVHHSLLPSATVSDGVGLPRMPPPAPRPRERGRRPSTQGAVSEFLVRRSTGGSTRVEGVSLSPCAAMFAEKVLPDIVTGCNPEGFVSEM